MTAKSVWQLLQESPLKSLSFSCSNIDASIGRFPCRGICEISGEAGAGKTQIALSLTLEAVVGGDRNQIVGSAAYITCGEGQFPIKRLLQLASKFENQDVGINAKDILSCVHIEECLNFEDVVDAVKRRIPEMCRTNNIRLLVIDSLAGMIRHEYDALNPNDMRDRTNFIFSFAKHLKWLSDTFQIGILVVNQVTATGLAQAGQEVFHPSFASPNSIPALGLTWSTCVTHRYIVSKLPFTYREQSERVEGNESSSISHHSKRVLELIFSPLYQSNACYFYIDSEGLHGIDNRVIPHNDFHRESLAASLQHYLHELIYKLCIISRQHEWFPSSINILGASSPATMAKFEISNKDEIHKIQNALEPRFSVLGGNLMSKNTWSDYLVSALSILSSTLSPIDVHNKITVTFYATDAMLFGDNGMQSNVVDGMKTFLAVCKDICNKYPYLDLRIVAACINLRGFSHSIVETTATINQEIFLREVSNLRLPIKLDTIFVSSLQIDFELRTIVGELVPDPISRINLNPSGEPCNIFVSLKPHTLLGADCIPYMSDMEYCGTCHRQGLNPLFLAGHGLEVCLPTKRQVHEEFEDQQLLYNRTLLQSLKEWLAKTDTILVFKVAYVSTGQTSQCAKFWALIPPIAPEATIDGSYIEENMALILLNDRDQLVASTTFQTQEDCHAPIFGELFSQFQQLLPTLIAVPSTQDQYNPWGYIGGSTNAQFDLLRRSATSQSHYNHTQPPSLAAQQQQMGRAQSEKNQGALTSSSHIVGGPISLPNPSVGSKSLVPPPSRPGAQAKGNSTSTAANTANVGEGPRTTTGSAPRASNEAAKGRTRQAIAKQSTATVVPNAVETSHGKTRGSKTNNANAKSATAQGGNAASNKLGFAHDNDDGLDDAALFQAVQTTRPRFLKRKFSAGYDQNGAKSSNLPLDKTHQSEANQTVMLIDSSDDEFA